MDRRGLTHEEANDHLPAYVMGALDDRESAAVSAHLARCELCRSEQARLEETFGLVGLSASSIEPPAGLRARVLGQLEEAEPIVMATPANASTSRGWASRLSQVGLAAAAVVLVGLLSWAILLRNDLQSTRGSLNNAMQHQTNSAELLANVSRTIPMVADGSLTTYGTLYIGSQSNEALLVVERLPPTPANRMYQVWLNSGSTRVSAALFTVDSSGSAMVMVQAPQPLTDYQSLGITSEPAPKGSPAPTGPRVIGCTLK